MKLTVKISLSLLTLILILTFASYNFCLASPDPPKIDKVIIVSGKKGSVPTAANKIVEYEAEINLYTVLKDKQGYYLGYESSSLPSKAKINGKLFSLKRWKEDQWGKITIKWYKVASQQIPSHSRGGYKWYSNVFSEQEGEEGEWRGWQIIEYKQLPLEKRGWSIELEKKAGTARFRTEVVFNGKTFSSPGKPSSNHPSGIAARDYYRGIKDTVHRISRLSEHPNKLVRYIEALRGVPWLWGPAYRDPDQETPSSHQSDFHNPVGIECSSVLISALRAMGNQDLEYTKTKNLAIGKYTVPITDATLTYTRRDFFKNWTPRGIEQSNEGNFYIYGTQKIQIRDKQFQLVKEINVAPFQLIDIAIWEEKIYCLVEKDLHTKIAFIDPRDKMQELFVPKVKKTIPLGEEKYTCEVSINPTGIAVGKVISTANRKQKRIYLLDSDTIHIFNLKGQELKAIPVEKNLTEWNIVDSLEVKDELFYIPVQKGKLLAYNMKGELVKTIDIQGKEKILNADVGKDKIAVLYPFPLRMQLFRRNGSFFLDLTDRFLTERGQEVIIRIDKSPQALHVGDLMVTISPSFHLLIFYKDNGNNILDSKDKVICAGHEGIEIREVSYFEDRKFLLKRLEPDIKVK